MTGEALRIGRRLDPRVLFTLILMIFSLISPSIFALPQNKTVLHPLSKQDLLGVRERALFAEKTRRAAQADTLRILALRAQFVADQVATTTGNGRFDLSNSSSTVLDRPPHNRTYFQHQLSALSHYFRRVSNSQLILISDVFPASEDGSYSLPQDMVYYSGQEDEDVKKMRWAELLRDAVVLADAENEIDFSLYDMVIVFHAGVGNDFAFDFDPTPYDIQSVFIDFATLKETLGRENPSFAGIAVAAGLTIREGIILPETQNQEGLDLGLLGTMTLLVGSQIGMPSLFNTQNGQSGIGRWGLMDQGSYNFQGFIPAEPCAWTKVYMGWAEPIVIAEGENLPLGCAGVAAPQLYKVPISDSEYFLLENRQRDRNGDGIAIGRDSEGRRVEFDSSGTVTVQDGIGVLTQVDDYDFGLPGSGILIWHIDENVIREKLADNAINNDREHRGVDLVECDGAQDIGYYYDIFSAGYGTESGDFFDPYWSGNVSHRVVNNSETVQLTPQSIPNSHANNGALSHMRFFNFSSRDTLMSFSLSSDWGLSGFPRFTGAEFSPGALLPVQLDAQRTALVAISSAGAVFAWRHDGTPLAAEPVARTRTDLYGRQQLFDVALLMDLQEEVVCPPAAADLDGDGREELIICAAGHVYRLNLLPDGDSFSASLLALTTTQSAPSAGPMLVDLDGQIAVVWGEENGRVAIGRLTGNDFSLLGENSLSGMPVCGLAALPSSPAVAVAATCAGEIFVLRQDGGILWQAQTQGRGTAYQPVVADLNPTGHEKTAYQPLMADLNSHTGVDVALVSNAGEFFVWDEQGSLLVENRFSRGFASEFVPALGDMDGDGWSELIFGGDGVLAVFEQTGWPSTNFPAQIRGYQKNSYATNGASPLYFAASRSANSSMEKLAIISCGPLLAGFDSQAKAWPGLHLTLGSASAAGPIAVDIDADGDIDLFSLAQDGFLYGWDLPIDSDDGYNWPLYGGDRKRSFCRAQPAEPVAVSARLMPAEKAFCYPNPTKDLQTQIRYSLSRDAKSVTIRIYDLAGDFVQSLPAPGIQAGDHEVRWHVDSVASGVYLARVEAIDSDETNTRVIKIAVVK